MSSTTPAATPLKPLPERLPPNGEVFRYIFTSAQNNTQLHRPTWVNLQAFAKHINAEIVVATFTYNKQALGAKGAKRKTSKEGDGEQVEWWVPEVLPYVKDCRMEAASGLEWCGELQILPTAVNPIAGLESYTGRNSSIIPHPKFTVKTVPSPKYKGTKFIYTTGTVTEKNYIQKKAGQKAEFHHGYGALLVEVNSEGSWFARQICADEEGTFFDFDLMVRNGEVTSGHRPEALVWGDIHERQLEQHIRDLAWGEGGILDALRPRVQVFHDLLDFRSQNHHDRDDHWKMYEKHVHCQTSIKDEIFSAGNFLNEATRPWCHTKIACSNHDEAFVRWLKEGDFRTDPENALVFLEVNLVVYNSMKLGRPVNPIEWAFCNFCEPKWHNVQWLKRDDSYVV